MKNGRDERVKDFKMIKALITIIFWELSIKNLKVHFSSTKLALLTKPKRFQHFVIISRFYRKTMLFFKFVFFIESHCQNWPLKLTNLCKWYFQNWSTKIVAFFAEYLCLWKNSTSWWAKQTRKGPRHHPLLRPAQLHPKIASTQIRSNSPSPTPTPPQQPRTPPPQLLLPKWQPTTLNDTRRNRPPLPCLDTHRLIYNNNNTLTLRYSRHQTSLPTTPDVIRTTRHVIRVTVAARPLPRTSLARAGVAEVTIRTLITTSRVVVFHRPLWRHRLEDRWLI